MLISELLEGIREDFTALGQLGGPETASIAERLSAAIEPSLRTHFLEALNHVIQEFNLQDSVALTLNLEGDQIRISRVVSAAADADADADVAVPTPSDYSARIALRLSDGLKEDIEHLATDVGSSMNSWIVRTLERSVRSDPTDSMSKHPRQLRGKGRA
jgi:antitoxin component of MazEF toxin-antitoxin module